MKRFADLYAAIDGTTKTNEKVDAIAAYLAAAAPEDAVWAIHFLIGRRPKRLIETRKLVQLAIDESALPAWIFDESYQAVGDLAETISLLLPNPSQSTDQPLHFWVEERLLPLARWDDTRRREVLVSAWRGMDESQRFVWNKLITGAFRVGVSQSLVVRAMSRVSGVDANVISHRLMGDWEPAPASYARLLGPDTGDAARDADVSRPYPFFLAYPIEGDIRQLGALSDWQIEWKWDGIRAQLIRRRWNTFLWSRGEDLMTERFPEMQALGALLPEGTVLDGEVLAWKDGQPLPFAQMQRRIGRKALSEKMLRDVPAALIAYDLLEDGGVDIRELPIEERRRRLERVVYQTAVSGHIHLSAPVAAPDWEALEHLRLGSRARAVEGFMLKRLGSPYRVGRKRGDWWKWKIEPYAVDAVLIYAQAGSGKRASLFTDYTFAVWDGPELVPFAKAYSGLTDEEIRKVDAFVRRHTVEKFGPVRSVAPELVFELAFEGIQKSPRHRSGIAVRFPRIARWRTDKKPQDADTLETVKALIG